MISVRCDVLKTRKKEEKKKRRKKLGRALCTLQISNRKGREPRASKYQLGRTEC